MTARFTLRPAGDPIHADAVYRAEDYALLLYPGLAPPRGHYRLTIDTLTLLIHPVERVLVALDAYTNIERWHRTELIAPSAEETALITCIESFDEHGLGEGAAGQVEYSFSPEASLLRVRLAASSSATHVRCFDCLVCGLSADGDLVELWIERLRFER
jgi:hypothetical protein